jgi:hypothetical protein
MITGLCSVQIAVTENSLTQLSIPAEIVQVNSSDAVYAVRQDQPAPNACQNTLQT